MLTTTEAAALLGVSRPRVLALIHLGTLQAKKHGRDWQVDAASVEAYKNSPRKAGRRSKTEVKSMHIAHNIAHSERKGPEDDTGIRD
jgi:excisionase family DNA binding protein